MRKKKTEPHVNHERWLVSYADFITLMFAFFVVMYATSKADVKKQAQMADSIDSAFRTLGLFQQNPTKNGAAGLAHNQDSPVTPMNIVMGDELMAPPAVKVDLEKLKERLSGMLSNQIADHVVSMKIGRDGLVISLREVGFYESGSAVVHPNSLPILNKIAMSLSSSPYDIRIEGHTDNIPIHTEQFDSNWELSTSRATRLTRIFVDDGFAPYRLSASGYAEFHPVAPNDTAENRSQNRRVDIIVLPRTSPHPELKTPAPKANCSPRNKMRATMPSPLSLRQQAESLYDEAIDLVAVGNPAQAAASFRQALNLDPSFLDAMHGLIRALQDAGDYNQAIATANQLITLDPEDILAHTSLSILYQHQGMVPEAEAEALKAKLLGWKLELRTSANLSAN